ncbi:hypothetical protein OIE63_16640 [Streptomyces sp. NBC_01795]|uniref:hypothetical protein n=1 Tax=unclassified Streptomyces TaxID=2593676 RepID=UPI002DDC4E4B|nr:MULTISPECIES: hypothetical protein [unclassified Streptomyces]WSA93018.1 hypothetical protein OIE63_16640 [Streptomyces sp. NBC_01795]WSB77388.1 hypothetical protein OHB04_17475 [Streptomyces sp. NBC_01775]
MTVVTEVMTRSWRRCWERWPCWVGWAAMIWAVMYAGFGLVCVLNGISPFHKGGAQASRLGWAVVATGVLSALLSGASVRYGLRPLLRTALWVMCGLAGIAAFSLLMDVITLMFAQGVDSWASATNHALAAAGAVLLAATARADRRPSSATAYPPASSAAPQVQCAAWAGTVAFVPYAAMKLNWALGGTFAGTSGDEILATSQRNGASGSWLTLASWGLDATTLLAALGVFLLWGLVRPWGQVFPRWTSVLRGRRVPRWLPLIPALIGAATLAPYGVVGAGYLTLVSAGALTMRSGDFPSVHDALQVSWVGIIAFGVYGLALTVAARSYWFRTRRQPGV